MKLQLKLKYLGAQWSSLVQSQLLGLICVTIGAIFVKQFYFIGFMKECRKAQALTLTCANAMPCSLPRVCPLPGHGARVLPSLESFSRCCYFLVCICAGSGWGTQQRAELLITAGFLPAWLWPCPCQSHLPLFPSIEYDARLGTKSAWLGNGRMVCARVCSFTPVYSGRCRPRRGHPVHCGHHRRGQELREDPLHRRQHQVLRCRDCSGHRGSDKYDCWFCALAMFLRSQMSRPLSHSPLPTLLFTFSRVQTWSLRLCSCTDTPQEGNQG